MMKNLIVILITAAIIILPIPLFGEDTQAPGIPTAPIITKVDDTYVVPVNIAPCPVCHLKSWIVIEDAPTKIIQVRCTNPQHQYLLVISGGDTYQEAVENWNTR